MSSRPSTTLPLGLATPSRTIKRARYELDTPPGLTAAVDSQQQQQQQQQHGASVAGAGKDDEVEKVSRPGTNAAASSLANSQQNQNAGNDKSTLKENPSSAGNSIGVGGTTGSNSGPVVDLALQMELEDTRKLNRAFEAIDLSMSEARDKLKTFYKTADETNTLLDMWIRVLSQSEHTRNLLQDPEWEGRHLEEARDRERLERNAAYERAVEEANRHQSTTTTSAKAGGASSRLAQGNQNHTSKNNNSSPLNSSQSSSQHHGTPLIGGNSNNSNNRNQTYDQSSLTSGGGGNSNRPLKKSTSAQVAEAHAHASAIAANRKRTLATAAAAASGSSLDLGSGNSRSALPKSQR